MSKEQTPPIEQQAAQNTDEAALFRSAVRSLKAYQEALDKGTAKTIAFTLGDLQKTGEPFPYQDAKSTQEFFSKITDNEDIKKDLKLSIGKLPSDVTTIFIDRISFRKLQQTQNEPEQKKRKQDEISHNTTKEEIKEDTAEPTKNAPHISTNSNINFLIQTIKLLPEKNHYIHKGEARIKFSKKELNKTAIDNNIPIPYPTINSVQHLSQTVKKDFNNKSLLRDIRTKSNTPKKYITLEAYVEKKLIDSLTAPEQSPNDTPALFQAIINLAKKGSYKDLDFCVSFTLYDLKYDSDKALENSAYKNVSSVYYFADKANEDFSLGEVKFYAQTSENVASIRISKKDFDNITSLASHPSGQEAQKIRVEQAPTISEVEASPHH